MTAGALAKELLQYEANSEVMIMWEGIFVETHGGDVYRAPNGVIVIDADEDGKWYREEILSGKLVPH